MAPVAGEPMIARVIDSLQAAGIGRYIVVAAPHDRELLAFCESRTDITVRQQVKARGSGDALKVCEADIHAPFVVSACDSLLDTTDIFQAMKLFVQERADAVLSVQEVPHEVSLQTRSVVRLTGASVQQFIEKPSEAERLSNITSLPLWVLAPTVFAELHRLEPSPRGEYELPAIFNAMIAAGQRVLAYRAGGRTDLTTIADLLEINRRFLRAMSPTIQVHPLATVPASVKLIPPVKIDAECQIGEDAQLGPEVYLERRAVVTSGVQLERVVVVSDARATTSGADRVYTDE
jgi:glucose-1-phosphate thymidylyltransferase